MKNIVFGLLLLITACAKPVATGTDASWKRKEMKRYGFIEFGVWHYGKLKMTGGNKLYAIKVEKENGKLIAYCEETVYDYHKDSYGPFDESVPFQQCTNEWLLSTLRMIEDQ